MTEKIWVWQGGKLHQGRESNSIAYKYYTPCGLAMHGPNVYKNYRKIPLFIRKQYCKKCQKRRK